MDLYNFIRDLLRGQRWGKVLSSPLSYQLVEKALTLTRKNFEWQATYLMAKFALAQTRRAYTGKVPVIWTSAFFPVELVWGLDLCPFSPEVAAAFITALGFGEEALLQGELAGYSRDLCSFHRCIAGAAQADYLPRPSALVASTHLCDGAPLLFQNMAKMYNTPFFVLDVPYKGDANAEAYVADQLVEIWTALADISGRKPDLVTLRETLRYGNDFRANLVFVNEMRRRVPALLRGSEMLNYLYLFFAGQGSREAAEVLACLVKELSAREAVPREGKREKHRLLWLHLKPYYKGELMDCLENKEGAVLAFEEMSHVYWSPLELEEPFQSLARKILAHFAYKPLDTRITTIARLAREYQVDGIVHFSHWGCRQSSGGALILRDELQRAGWPVLVLDGDCLDGRNEASGAMLTRVQAFLEILAENKALCAWTCSMSKGE